MTRNPKALGLALLAVVAMSAIAAQAASAITHTFTSTAANTIITGVNTTPHKFEAGVVAISCTTVTFDGTLTGTDAANLTVTPHYTDCTMGGNPATVEVSGCQYILGGETNEAGRAPVKLECSHTGSITVTGPACTIHFSDTHTGEGTTVNQDLTGVTYTQNGLNDITMAAEIPNVTSEATGFGCKILDIEGTRHTGLVKGSSTLSGDKADLSVHQKGRPPRTHVFTSTLGSQTTVTGTSTGSHAFIAGSTAVTCTTTTFHGTMGASQATFLTVTPAYSGCSMGGSPATVDVSGCQYVLSGMTDVHGHAAASLECNHIGGSITITGPACTIHFSDTHTGGGVTVNQGLTGVTYAQGGVNDLNVKATIGGIAFEGTGFGCEILGVGGTKQSGVTTGDMTLSLDGGNLSFHTI